jgi:16S rRNA G966 N2-methylase RsmD
MGDFDIIQKDVLEYLRFCNNRKWDIIFLDPPYNIEAGKMKDIFEAIAGKGIVGKNSVLVYEFFFKRQVDSEIGYFKLVKESFFGDKKVIYLELEDS